MAHNQQSSNPQSISPRLHYLDSLRGVASLYIVLFHVYLQIVWADTNPLPKVAQYLTKWLNYGDFSVATFIVLSGYCLMIPVAKSGGVLRGGFWGYMKRRSRRILPPYYAALALSLIAIILFPVLQSGKGTIWELTHPALTPSAIASHLLLLHNFVGEWTHTINYPLWSVALEWQIYFFLPLLLLPVLKRWGMGSAIAVSVILGIAPYALLNGHWDVFRSWYLSLFTFGMMAAMVGFSQDSTSVALRSKVAWGRVLIALCVSFPIVLTLLKRLSWMSHKVIVSDFLAGLVIACFLIYCTRSLTQGLLTSRPFPLRLLEQSWLISLGQFSYSLYLIHAPVVALIDLTLQANQASPVLRLVIGLGISTPLSVMLSYLFHLAFERRFMSIPSAKKAMA